MFDLQGKKVGLALGGGGALGAAHIGVLKAMGDLGIRIGCISGTSAGALVASLYAFGVSRKKLAKLAHEIKWMEISKLSLSQYGLLSNEKLDSLIEENIERPELKKQKFP